MRMKRYIVYRVTKVRCYNGYCVFEM
jgi:hypothetical protein